MLPTGDGYDSGEFVVSADGSTVTDTITGLVWQRNGMGTRAACTTDSTHLTCTQAEAWSYCNGLSLGGFSDWRLPAEHEMQTIVDLTQNASGIDLVFPQTTETGYWTSSPDVLSSGNAWAVALDAGFVSSWPVGSLSSVRCVRGSRCYPTSRFVAAGGLVTDTLTNLVWQQQASSTTMTWTAAQSYCSAAGSGFRLPTLKELESIVDLTVTSAPTINQTAFPNMPVKGYWTSSPYPYNRLIQVFCVGFNGGANGNYNVDDSSGVRCVH